MQQLGGPEWGPQLLLSQGGCGEGVVGILSLLTLIVATAAAPGDRSRRSHRVQDPSPFPDVAWGRGAGRLRTRSQVKERTGTEPAAEASPAQQLLSPLLGVSFSLRVWEVSSLLLASPHSLPILPPPPTHSLLPPATPLSPPVPRKGPVASGADESSLWAGSPIQRLLTHL